MTDPRIEAAAQQVAVENGYPANYFPDGMSKVAAKNFREEAARIVAAIDKAATIATVEELDALPGGSSILHDEGFQKLPAKRSVDDGHWHVTGSNEYRRAETLLPATVIHWGSDV